MAITNYVFKQVDEVPNKSNTEPGIIYLVRNKWAVFKCPCGCNINILLNLFKGKRPCWDVDEKEGTIKPSINQLDGCKSHFWITRGKVNMC